MKLLLAASLWLSPVAVLAQDEEDFDSSQVLTIGEARTTIQKADQEAKTAAPERKQELARERTEAVASIEAVATRAPKSPAVNLEAGKALVEVDEPAKALPFADRAVVLAPQNPEARVTRGNARFALGEYRAAAEDAKAALRLDSKSEPAKALLKFSETRLADMASRVKLPPKGSLVRQQPGDSASPDTPRPATLPEPKKALAAAGPAGIAGRDAAAAGKVKAGEALRDARARLALGDAEGAARLGRKAALLAPRDGGVAGQAAYLRLKAGDPAGAREDAERAVALEPSGENYLVLAAAHDALGQAPLARAQLTRAARTSARYANFLDKASGMSPEEFSRFLSAELSAKFTPGYDAALGKLGSPEARPEAAGRGPVEPAGAAATGNVLRWAIAAVGLLLIGGIAWGLADRARENS